MGTISLLGPFFFFVASCLSAPSSYGSHAAANNKALEMRYRAMSRSDFLSEVGSFLQKNCQEGRCGQ